MGVGSHSNPVAAKDALVGEEFVTVIVNGSWSSSAFVSAVIGEGISTVILVSLATLTLVPAYVSPSSDVNVTVAAGLDLKFLPVIVIVLPSAWKYCSPALFAKEVIIGFVTKSISAL